MTVIHFRQLKYKSIFGAVVTDVRSVRLRPLLLQSTFASSASNGENRNDISAACWLPGWLAWLILAPSCSEETGLECLCVYVTAHTFAHHSVRHLSLVIILIRTGSVQVCISNLGINS